MEGCLGKVLAVRGLIFGKLSTLVFRDVRTMINSGYLLRYLMKSSTLSASFGPLVLSSSSSVTAHSACSSSTTFPTSTGSAKFYTQSVFRHRTAASSATRSVCLLTQSPNGISPPRLRENFLLLVSETVSTVSLSLR